MSPSCSIMNFDNLFNSDVFFQQICVATRFPLTFAKILWLNVSLRVEAASWGKLTGAYQPIGMMYERPVYKKMKIRKYNKKDKDGRKMRGQKRLSCDPSDPYPARRAGTCSCTTARTVGGPVLSRPPGSAKFLEHPELCQVCRSTWPCERSFHRLLEQQFENVWCHSCWSRGCGIAAKCSPRPPQHGFRLQSEKIDPTLSVRRTQARTHCEKADEMGGWCKWRSRSCGEDVVWCEKCLRDSSNRKWKIPFATKKLAGVGAMAGVKACWRKNYLLDILLSVTVWVKHVAMPWRRMRKSNNCRPHRKLLRNTQSRYGLNPWIPKTNRQTR